MTIENVVQLNRLIFAADLSAEWIIDIWLVIVVNSPLYKILEDVAIYLLVLFLTAEVPEVRVRKFLN